MVSDCVFKLSKKQQKELIEKIQLKICSLANIGLLEIWMQRMSVGLKVALKLNEKLCKTVSGDNHKIFETGWISDQVIKKIIDDNLYVDKKILSKMKPRIEKKEVQIFNPYYNQ